MPLSGIFETFPKVFQISTDNRDMVNTIQTRMWRDYPSSAGFQDKGQTNNLQRTPELEDIKKKIIGPRECKT
jgi:hypothetical protein